MEAGLVYFRSGLRRRLLRSDVLQIRYETSYIFYSVPRTLKESLVSQWVRTFKSGPSCCSTKSERRKRKESPGAFGRITSEVLLRHALWIHCLYIQNSPVRNLLALVSEGESEVATKRSGPMYRLSLNSTVSSLMPNILLDVSSPCS